MKLRIAAVQLNPIIGHVEDNCRRAVQIIEMAFKSRQPPDLIILPELALTGYNFRNREHINPYLELKGQGRSYKLGRQLSEKYHCHTLLGYPEKSRLSSNDFKVYNSAILISPSGDVVFNYRKTFLYETDENWGCVESPDGFQAFNLNIKGHTFKTSIGICMDLNPYKFKAPFDKFEFANFCYKNDVDLVLLPTAWLNTSWSEDWTQNDVDKYTKLYHKEEAIEVNTDESQNEIILAPEEPDHFVRCEPDKKTGRYWILRMNPLYTKPHPGKKKLVIICNRSGMEGSMMYAGTSSIFEFNGGPSRFNEATGDMFIDFNVDGSLGQGNEGVLLRGVEI
ncbi:hypothetical protein FOA43_000034 [Brettanomyces nanus]|uniref:CN hydrolase domain-containing protein n=1 Tax=Eeniella nana TaxID=13502 RepID=A0A875RWD1_EENNA|nr:uncharacterized protein FOA43_000034 [Brettanomyces nanus]QPG72733.1 hypothetical protein FOA43_000034 [Brettanomyces nanus]